MKTTLDIPDELMRRVKMRAIQRNQKLKDVVAQLLDAGMAAASTAPTAGRAPKPVRLKGRRRLNIDDIQSAIAAGGDY